MFAAFGRGQAAFAGKKLRAVQSAWLLFPLPGPEGRSEGDGIDDAQSRGEICWLPCRNRARDEMGFTPSNWMVL
jgi:hypothetical protein